MNVYIENSLRFIIVFLIQIFILNNIYLHGLIVPILYVYFIIKLPFYMPKVPLLLVAFTMGILIDLCTGTPGINAATTTAVAFIRPIYVKMVLPNMTKDNPIEPSISNMGFIYFFVFSSLMVFTHSFLICFFEAFGFSHFGQTLLRSLLTALISLLLVIVFEMLTRLFSPKK